jgi:outer membrane protein assembly factor BamB
MSSNCTSVSNTNFKYREDHMTHLNLNWYRIGRQACLALGAILLLAGFCLGQTVTLSVKSGAPTAKISVSGSGFGADAAIDIYFDTTDEALALANSSGAFSKIEIQVPAAALPGPHWISAVQVSSGTGAQVPFKVITNWSQFRFGTNHQGTNPYENVLSTKNVDELDVQWIFTTQGAVESSPAVVNGVVYIGSDDGNLYALNAATGAMKWSYFTGTAAGRADNSCPSCLIPAPIISSPAVANGAVFFGSSNNGVYALSASTGSLLWTFTTGGPVTSSPAVANGAVYIGSNDGNLYALNATTGALLWSYATGLSQGNLSPAVAEGVVYAACNSLICGLDATTGALVSNQGAGLASPTSSVAIAAGVAYLGDNDTLGQGYSMEAYGLRFPGESGFIWSDPTQFNLPAYASPAFANNVVYFGDVYLGGAATAFALDAANGNLLWSAGFFANVNASPAVANGIVFLGVEDDNVYALDAANGNKLWFFPTGNEVDSSPSVVNGIVYIGSEDFNVYAFGLPNPPQNNSAQRPAFSSLHPDLTLKP